MYNLLLENGIARLFIIYLQLYVLIFVSLYLFFKSSISFSSDIFQNSQFFALKKALILFLCILIVTSIDFLVFIFLKYMKDLSIIDYILISIMYFLLIYFIRGWVIINTIMAVFHEDSESNDNIYVTDDLTNQEKTKKKSLYLKRSSIILKNGFLFLFKTF